MPDWVTWFFIIIGVYSYFQNILRLRNCLGKTILKLEKNLRSIKNVAQVLAGIFVKKTYKVSQGELTTAKAKSFKTKKKFVLGCTSNAK